MVWDKTTNLLIPLGLPKWIHSLGKSKNRVEGRTREANLHSEHKVYLKFHMPESITTVHTPTPCHVSQMSKRKERKENEVDFIYAHQIDFAPCIDLLEVIVRV